MNGRHVAIGLAMMFCASVSLAGRGVTASERKALLALPSASSELSIRDPAGGTLAGTAANDLIMGSPGPDKIDGGKGDDGIRTERGDDQLHGGGGDDYLKGGAGNDLLKGGPGNDRYVFAPGDGKDRLEDTDEPAGADAP